MKTKAVVTVEIEIDTTGIPTQTGLGESSNPQTPPKRRVIEAKKEFIWEVIHKALADQIDYVQVKEVRFPKEVQHG